MRSLPFFLFVRVVVVRVVVRVRVLYILYAARCLRLPVENVLLRANERCLWTGTRCRLEINLWRTARQLAPTAKTTVRERPILESRESVPRMWRSRVEPALYYAILHTVLYFASSES